MEENELGTKIGLEIHVQLTCLKTKLFCGCSSNYRGKEPNTNLCPICMGLPGSLPVLNEKAVKVATLVSFALSMHIQSRMLFFRKNYYYPDMPKNFQITQYDQAGGVPFSTNGKVVIEGPRQIRITRIQLEEDPARLVYEGTIDSSTATLVDYNRAGIALIEIVTEPDLRSPKDARVFLDKLKSIVESLGISESSLEGSMRCDANISLKGGIRVEIKNISSFKEVERALNFEISRQKSLIEKGMKVKKETRHWDEVRRITVSLRTKEAEQDYRYFPEPDLVPIELSNEFLQEIKCEMPELPEALQQRLIDQYSISISNAKILSENKDFAVYFEQCNKIYQSPVEISNWIVSDIIPSLSKKEISLSKSQISPNSLCSLIRMLKAGQLNRATAKRVLNESMETGKLPESIAKEQGLTKIVDRSQIERVINEVFEKNQPAVKDAIRNEDAIDFLVGLSMKATKGQADPKLINEIIREKLLEWS
ncbi:Asp-tRNA(Asn)/Glu-tRNA(Gln) amidotransferase subunit GatB [Candidatus Bathycorpusculum sp.]|uniref:Asp-tRNA(Asn)/Glu-tRNA(Gln) amidotransferase subunit GatB n=1 Tax=Candidatus Bathycorpusculum sp. TaxID=2994959 RepID=UPI002838E054|nr:Asp-tRNA(Asn)/Glu-tRNA(Gln) amidotransferase subunit GatB [Candidatus Termitimicrobium sp.]